jgi:hypothetical protein
VRGTPERQMAMLTTLSPEVLIPEDHPIRRIRAVVDAVLADLHGEWFCAVAWDGSLVTRGVMMPWRGLGVGLGRRS